MGSTTSEVPALGVAPRKAITRGHLEDHRVACTERVGTPVARLRLAAADVAARGAEAQSVVRAAFLAPIAARRGDRQRCVIAEAV